MKIAHLLTTIYGVIVLVLAIPIAFCIQIWGVAKVYDHMIDEHIRNLETEEDEEIQF